MLSRPSAEWPIDRMGVMRPGLTSTASTFLISFPSLLPFFYSFPPASHSEPENTFLRQREDPGRGSRERSKTNSVQSISPLFVGNRGFLVSIASVRRDLRFSISRLAASEAKPKVKSDYGRRRPAGKTPLGGSPAGCGEEQKKPMIS